MFEFLIFIAACAVIAFLVTNIQKYIDQPKVKLQPIKIKREEIRGPSSRQKRPY